MNSTILLINFKDKPRFDKIIRAILPLKVRIKSVNKENYLQPIGYLAGKNDIDPIEKKYDGQEIDDEMLLLAHMSNSQLNQVLLALRKSGVGINLKAVLTENNQYWNTLQLYDELKKEREALNKTL